MKKAFLLTLTAIATMTVNAGNLEKGVDRSNLDLSVSPGENFYQDACGGWQKAHPLDPQYARFGTFDQLGENSREQVKDIITNLGENLPKVTIAQKVSDLYLLGMDVDRLNADGAKPLHEAEGGRRLPLAKGSRGDRGDVDVLAAAPCAHALQVPCRVHLRKRAAVWRPFVRGEPQFRRQLRGGL